MKLKNQKERLRKKKRKYEKEALNQQYVEEVKKEPEAQVQENKTN